MLTDKHALHWTKIKWNAFDMAFFPLQSTRQNISCESCAYTFEPRILLDVIVYIYIIIITLILLNSTCSWLVCFMAVNAKEHNLNWIKFTYIRLKVTHVRFGYNFSFKIFFELYKRSFVLRFTFSIAHKLYVTRSKYCIHSMNFIHYDKRQKQNAIRRSRDLMYLQFNKLYKINRDFQIENNWVGWRR